jgi:hypothetical protein
MTGTYEWNPMPHQVDVKCPRCGLRAEFEFAEVRRIERKEDIAFFEKSTQFEYRQFQDACGHHWHGAIWYAGLHGDPCTAVDGLPPGYTPGDWSHSKYACRSHGLDIGSVRCGHCHRRGLHKLAWPADAWYAVPHRGQLLWAFHRESALELHDYLLSAARDVSRYRWPSFLLHIPTAFKTHKARDAVCTRLQRLLADSARSPARPASRGAFSPSIQNSR